MNVPRTIAVVALAIGFLPGAVAAQGPPVPPLFSVTHDATLSGNGTISSPLKVVSPFTGVKTDATLTGNGTAASPLSAGPSNTPPRVLLER